MTRALSVATVLALGGCRIDTEIEVATVTDAIVETDEGSAGGGDAESTSGSGDDTGTTGDGAALPFPPAGPDAAPDPSVFGPYPVGVTTLELVDTARVDEEGRPRPVVTEVWYPAVEDARGQPGSVSGLADVLRPEALELVDTMGIAMELPTEAVRDAAPRDDGERFPVVLFSHGASGVRMQSTFLTAALASHGYVVASPDHFGNTLSDTIVAGGFAQEDHLVAMGVRPADLRFVLEELEALGDGDPLGAIVDGDRVGTLSDIGRLDPAAIEGAMTEIALPTQRHFAIAHFNAVLRDSPGSAALLTAAEAQRLAAGEADSASN